MTRLSKNGIKSLKKQYLSVLLKCMAINAGLFMLAAPAMAGTPHQIITEDTTITDTSFTGYDGTGGTEDKVGYGGVFYNTKQLSFGNTATFTNNSASQRGGALLNAGNTTFSGVATFENNSAGIEGGALYNGFSRSTTFADTATFDGNSAQKGGAVYNAHSGSSIGEVTFSDTATFKNNTATTSGGDGYGGAIYNGGAMSFADAEFEGNNADYAGALYGKL